MFPSGNNIVIDTGCVRFMIILLNNIGLNIQRKLTNV